MRKAKPLSLRPAKANPGIRIRYRRELEAMARAMRLDVEGAILREWDAASWLMGPETASDGKWRTPAERLNGLLDRLASRWLKRFLAASEAAASRFVRSVQQGVRRSRRASLKDAGLAVQASPSRHASDVLQASIAANVELIKSIPEQYLGRVRLAVNRAVAGGMDRGALARELAHGYGITERRAAMIARDQTNKATQDIARAEDASMGVTEGIWRHVPGRKSSRPSHVKMHGKRFSLSEGLWDEAEGRKVLPGECVCCACVYAPVWPMLEAAGG